MVRTKADSCPAAGRKVVGARAPRKIVGASSSSGGSSSSSGGGASLAGNKYAGGNPVCPRPTPDWQKGIGTFFGKQPSNKENQATECEPGCSGSSDSADCHPGTSGGSSGVSESCAGSSGGCSSIAGPSSSKDGSDSEDADS